MRALASLSLLLVAAGCGSESVTLAVELQTDLVPGTDFDGATVELREGTDPTAPTLREAFSEVDASAAALADGVRIADFSGLSTGAYLLSVRLGGTPARRRDVLVTLLGDQTVPVVITRSCDDIECPPSEAPSRTECASGECVVPSCIVAGDPGCTGSCAMDSDCPDDGVACTAASCVMGACRAIADDAVCGAGERCHRVRGCEPGECAMTETDCGDGVDDDCDGRTDCEDSDCDDAACDDGDLCTHGDACTSGSCEGTAIVCEDDECSTRRCDGTDTCASTSTAAGTACGDDGSPCTRDECDGAGGCAHPAVAAGAACPADTNPCTRDECDGLGVCAHPPLPNGTSLPTGEFAACCGGVETMLNTRANCGGCGVACPGSRACNEVAFPDFPAHPACECSTASPACPGAQACNGFLNFCFCTEDRHCPSDQRCRMMPLPPSSNSHNYCGY